MAPPAADSFRFGRFHLDMTRRVLLVDGRLAKLSARSVDVLAALIDRRDRVVGKDELLELVWAGLVVEENNLQVHVSTLRKLLGAESIVTVPGRGYQFVAKVEVGSLDTPRGESVAPSTSQARTNLPAQPPVLFGREHDTVSLVELLGSNPLVTLAGPAGVGETVLARVVAHQLLDAFAGGVWWVDLSALREPKQVVAVTCRVLAIGSDDGLPTAAAVGAALRGQSLLLVLDNCEHLSEGVASLVATLLQRASGVRVLATSQESLRVPGEQVYRLPPLPVADVDPEHAAASGAVQLFAARVRAVQRGFALTAVDPTSPVDSFRIAKDGSTRGANLEARVKHPCGLPTDWEMMIGHI